MNFRGESIVDPAAADIAALDARVTVLEGKVSVLETKTATLESKMTTVEGKVSSLETRMTTAESNITTLQSQVATLQTGVFSGRVSQFTSHHTPFLISYLDPIVTITGNLTNVFSFITEVVSISPYLVEGAIFMYHSGGSISGANPTVRVALDDNTGPINGVYAEIVGTGAGSATQWEATAFLQATQLSGGNMNVRFVIRLTLGQSGGGSGFVDVRSLSGFNMAASPALIHMSINTVTGADATRREGMTWCFN